MSKLDSIKTSLDIDYSDFLNAYYVFLEQSKDLNFVNNASDVNNEIDNLISLLEKNDIKRVPYESITNKVNEFFAQITSNNDGEQTESLLFLFEQSTESLKVIVDKAINNSDNKPYSKNKSKINAIYAFHKVLEHTKLAYIQYQSLYLENRRQLEESVKELEKMRSELSKSKSEMLSFQSQITSQMQEQLGKQLQTFKDSTASIYTDFIAILGVFSSFVFVMFGGFSAISDIVGSLSVKEVSLTKTLLISNTLMYTIITIVYFLLTWVSKIIGKPIVNKTCDCKSSCKNIIHGLDRHRFYVGTIAINIIGIIITIILLSIKASN